VLPSHDLSSASRAARSQQAAAVPRSGTSINGLDVHESIADIHTYFGWLIESCRLAGHEPVCEILGQRRNRDGRRGGTFVPPGIGDALTTKNLTSSAWHAVRRAAQEGIELTFRLRGSEHPVLLVDDIGIDDLHDLPWPGAVIETAPGNLQATLVAHRPLSPQERLFAQRALQVSMGADPGAVGASQLRRLPGSINGKPELPSGFVARLHAQPAPSLPPASLVDALIDAGRAQVTSAAASISPSQDRDGRRAKHTEATDQSRVEFGWTMHQITRRRRRSDDELVRELTAKAAGRRRHGLPPEHPSHEHYARRTLAAAQRALGKLVGA
jgi:hypothetical protein